MPPSALDHVEEIAGSNDRLAVFLDYDGTLTAIVSDPKKALLSDSMRQTLQALVMRVSLAVLSGRDLDDIRKRVAIDAIVYGGNHGFDIAGPRGIAKARGDEFVANAGCSGKRASGKTHRHCGAFIERKRFSIAAHYRNVKENDAFSVAPAVDAVAARHRELRRMDGKKVYELLPDIDWDKGKAVLWLLEALELERGKVLPIYIGDDRTDEDAFSALEKRGVTILVSRATAGYGSELLAAQSRGSREFLQKSSLIVCTLRD